MGSLGKHILDQAFLECKQFKKLNAWEIAGCIVSPCLAGAASRLKGIAISLCIGPIIYRPWTLWCEGISFITESVFGDLFRDFTLGYTSSRVFLKARACIDHRHQKSD